MIWEYEDLFYVYLARSIPSRSRGLSTWEYPVKVMKNSDLFCRCFPPFYSTVCVESLLSIALFGCIFSFVSFG